jgi:hypothetical protein
MTNTQKYLLAGLGFIFFFSIVSLLALKMRTTSSHTPKKQALVEVKQIPTQAQPLVDAKELFFIRENNIWQANIDGTMQVQITQNQGTESGILQYYWLPKTQKLIYNMISSNQNNTKLQINLFSPQTKTEEVVFDKTVASTNVHFNFHFTVSPDETLIAYAENVTSWDNPAVIYNLNTKASQSIKSSKTRLPMFTPGAPIFSPDSKLVVDLYEDSNLYVYDIATQKQSQLTSYKIPTDINARRTYVAPTTIYGWLPSNQIIYSISNYGKGATEIEAVTDIYSYDVATTKDVRVSPHILGVQYQVLSMANGNIVYQSTALAKIDSSEKVKSVEEIKKSHTEYSGYKKEITGLEELSIVSGTRKQFGWGLSSDLNQQVAMSGDNVFFSEYSEELPTQSSIWSMKYVSEYFPEVLLIENASFPVLKRQ